MTADVEGMITYQALVDETLEIWTPARRCPATQDHYRWGSGQRTGIESSSFKFGLVHETIEEMEILLGDGRLVTCSCRENPDLFYGFPNSYGTLGYALRLTIRLIPAKAYVHLTHTRFATRNYFARVADVGIARWIISTVLFSGAAKCTSPKVNLSDEVPSVSDYTYMDIYYRSIQRKPEDWLTAKDYIWRWDTDWFWCSKHFYVQKPAVRRLFKWALTRAPISESCGFLQLLPDSGGTSR